MLYTEKELDEVCNLVAQGHTLQQAKNMQHPNRAKIKEIEEDVKSFFQVDTIKPKDRSAKSRVVQYTFVYMVCDFLKYPRTQKVYEFVLPRIGRHRCSYLKLVKEHEEGIHLQDTRYIDEDSFTNKYLKCKSAYDGHDYSGKYIKPYVPASAYRKGRLTLKEIVIDTMEKKKDLIISDIDKDTVYGIDLVYFFIYVTLVTYSYIYYKEELSILNTSCNF